MDISPIPTVENHPPTVLRVTGVMLGTSTFASPSTCLAFLDKRKKSKVVAELSRSLRVITTRKKSQQTDVYVAPHLLAQLKRDQARGVRLLDRKNPGWWRKVKITKLNMTSLANCIIGQVYGDYTNGLADLKVFRGSDYGFDVKMYIVTDGAYTILGELWKDSIRRRRARKGNTNRTRNRSNK